MKDFIKGCEILSKYNEDCEISAEHDVIYTNIEDVSDEDAALLDDLIGWHYDTYIGCWAYFT